MPAQGTSTNESRTGSVGKKRRAPTTASISKKKRKAISRSKRRAFHESSTSTPNLSVPSDQPDKSLNASADSLPSTGASASAQSSNMANLGKNRLAAGFMRPATLHDPQTQASVAALSTGESADSAIAISDDEDMGDSEGGMVLNLQEQQTKSAILVSDDDVESGEYSSPLPVPERSQDKPEHESSTVSHSEKPLRQLADLDAEQLEDQITYAFYYLERDQVDLNRSIVCLQCLSEGHLSTECKEKSKSCMRVPKVKAGDQIKLWISCCICASKEHLVGDCIQADRPAAKRWSLASLDPNQIINMSLESGTRKREVDAENRGMRPAGISIRGRAGRHNAGHNPQFETESSEEDFLHARRPAQQNNTSRYDRYDAPTGPRKGGPGPKNFYATDSFGRRRSRSPDSEQSTRDRRSSPPLRRGYDKWQPPPSQRQYSEQQESHYRPSAVPLPRQNIQIQLPERKGSNPHINQQNQSSNSGGGGKAYHSKRGGTRRKNQKT